MDSWRSLPPGQLAELAESSNPLLRRLHDYDVKLNPKPHRNAFLKPFHRLPDQVPKCCSACHKVHLDVPVNHYRWIRGFNDYDNWQASGVSGQGARSFYYPQKPRSRWEQHASRAWISDGKTGGRKCGILRSQSDVAQHRISATLTALPR